MRCARTGTRRGSARSFAARADWSNTNPPSVQARTASIRLKKTANLDFGAARLQYSTFIAADP